MRKVRYAVVGAGWISQEGFLPAVPQTGNSEVTAIITGNAEAGRRLAEFHGIERVVGYEDYDAALASGAFDAVYVAVPNTLHARYAVRALERGVHALVEKPLAASVAECEAMIDAAGRGGSFLMTAYRLHCEPGTVEAVRLVREGAIGRPRLFSAFFSAQIGDTNHRLSAANWGGPLQDVGLYCVNAARNILAAEPVEVVGMKGHGDDPRFSEIEESLGAVLRFPGDALATITVSFNAADVDTYRVVGTEGEIEMQPGFRFETPTRMYLRKGGAENVTTFPEIDQFGGQIAYFSDCILTGRPPVPDGIEGLADVRALLAIEQAAKSGMPQLVQSAARASGPTPEMIRLVDRTTRRLVL
mgnify:CR=1 FL=1